MFKWIKNKINKKLHKDQFIALVQCEKFLIYINSSTSGERGKLQPSLKSKEKIIENIKNKFYAGTTGAKETVELMKINKEFRNLYNKYFKFEGKSFHETFDPVNPNDYNKLVQPIILEVGPRISGGVIVAVAKTADGGAASVTWDMKTKSWVFAEGFGVGTVFAADPAPASILMAKGIPNQTKD